MHDTSLQLRIALGLGAGFIAVLGLAGGSDAAFIGLAVVSVILCLFLAVTWVTVALELKRLVAQSEGLGQRQILRNAWGLPLRIKAEVDGHDVLIQSHGIEVKVETDESVAYDPLTLKGLAEAGLDSSAPARVLAEAGIREVSLRGGLLRISGGQGPLSTLIRAAMELTHVNPRRLRSSPSSPGECPYCRQAVSFIQDAARRCNECDALHHNECWGEHGGCAVFGCKHGPRERRPSRPAATGKSGQPG